MDLFQYDNQSSEHQQLLAGRSVLILLSNEELVDTDAREANYFTSYFYIDVGSETSVRNMWAMINSEFEKSVGAYRLNSYIRDSFSDIVDSNLLLQQKKEIEELNHKLKEISRVDYLTNLLNRRALLESFEAEKRRALRCRWRLHNYVGPVQEKHEVELASDFQHQVAGQLDEHVGNFSCLMLDIDHFKHVNDTYGHLMGDAVLKKFGELLREKGLFRDTDVLGRYGGEEFIVLLPETNCKNAVNPALRLRDKIKAIEFCDETGRKFNVTISIGVSEFLPEEAGAEEMIKRADLALYYAKEHGRDQVCLYESATGNICQCN
jgi:diguanylate cyclase (GGDEF)-like protein